MPALFLPSPPAFGLHRARRMVSQAMLTAALGPSSAISLNAISLLTLASIYQPSAFVKRSNCNPPMHIRRIDPHLFRQRHPFPTL